MKKKKNHNRSVSLELLTRVGTSRGKPKRLEAIASRSQRGWEARRAQVHADSRCQVRCTSAYVPRNSPLFFSPLSLFLWCTGWSARVAEGRKGGCTSLERVNTAHRSGTHKYTVSQRESGTKSIARTYAVVYACTRTHPPHPEDTGTGGGGGGKGEAFNFSCCLHDQPEAEILAEEYAAVHGAQSRPQHRFTGYTSFIIGRKIRINL